MSMKKEGKKTCGKSYESIALTTEQKYLD